MMITYMAGGCLFIKVRQHWWQFWLPRRVCYGSWGIVGEVVQVVLYGDQPRVFCMTRAHWAVANACVDD